MSIQEVSPEQFAQILHHYHKALENEARTHESASEWTDVPPDARNRMILAARLAFLEVEQSSIERESRRYFAKPGEAEWGC